MANLKPKAKNEVPMKPLNRRKLLTSSVSAVAASTLLRADAQNTQTSTAGPFTVRSGEAPPGGQWLVHGEKSFSTKVSGTDVGKTYSAIEVQTPPNVGPPLHVHLAQNELLFILKGSIGLQCGSDRTVLRVGDAFMAPANVPHAYVTLGMELSIMLLIFDPAGDMEAFFAEYAPLVSVDGEPDQKKIAQALANHGMKVVGPPLRSASFLS